MHAHVYVTDSPNVPPHKETPSMRSEAAQILETPYQSPDDCPQLALKSF